MRNRLTNELAVCGFNAVSALGEVHPERINRLFLREDRLPAFTKLCKQLAEWKRPYKICEDEELERVCKSTRHQGIVAMIEEIPVEPLSQEDLDAWAREGKTGVILFSVGNDHNLGAIVRSAAFFDVPYVVISDTDEAAQLTTSAYRVAEGGMEHVEFRKLRNVPFFLKSAGKSMVIIGADHRARLRVRDLDRVIREKAAALGERPGIALVVGNEETGLPSEIKERCSALVRIPGTGAIESLNVAQAATLFFHEIYERC
ncbi:RNA methyltransferase, TrmH family [Treponema primitia ZAS-2]|uniref:RNA methyltransferase, TrmH family n=1 Tax=Treponema primitia (strain ATCC BAA-887 / DSM 12427 / ZAS-2) TaxID=545694 RepID=F5YKN5_TREPZ|nr:RNA methyltransferase [Treponema primitia]AEF86180.1 RNA methyltransferase, TrmH family [Treponema primitia ZAS-2]